MHNVRLNGTYDNSACIWSDVTQINGANATDPVADDAEHPNGIYSPDQIIELCNYAS